MSVVLCPSPALTVVLSPALSIVLFTVQSVVLFSALFTALSPTLGFEREFPLVFR
jgi:hypothetical protein